MTVSSPSTRERHGGAAAPVLKHIPGDAERKTISPDWDGLLGFLTFPYCQGVCATTKEKPAYPGFGRDLRRQPPHARPNPPGSMTNNQQQYLSSYERRLKLAWSVAEQTATEVYRQRARRANQARRDANLTEGQLIWYLGRRSKRLSGHILPAAFFHDLDRTVASVETAEGATEHTCYSTYRRGSRPRSMSRRWRCATSQRPSIAWSRAPQNPSQSPTLIPSTCRIGLPAKPTPRWSRPPATTAASNLTTPATSNPPRMTAKKRKARPPTSQDWAIPLSAGRPSNRAARVGVHSADGSAPGLGGLCERGSVTPLRLAHSNHDNGDCCLFCH